MHMPTLLLGVLIGWLLEMLVDYLFWRRRVRNAVSAEATTRESLAAAQAEMERLRGPAQEADRLWLEMSNAQMRIHELEVRLAEATSATQRLEAEAKALKTASTAAMAAKSTASDGLRPVSPRGADDLQVIEGIGPAIARLLQENGIRTFHTLSRVSPPSLQSILNAAGPRFRVIDPYNWPEQARYAAIGDWNGLSLYQAQIRSHRQAA